MRFGSAAFFGCIVAMMAVLTSCEDAAGVRTGRDASTSSRTVVAEALLRGATKDNKLVVTSTFAGPDGLTGVLYKPTDTSSVTKLIWATSDMEALIPGRIYGRTGTDLTKHAMYTHGVLISPKVAFQEAASKKTHSIVVGTSGPLLTFFLDPNCKFCHKLYDFLEPKVKSGKLKVRYVLVGIVNQSSVDRSVAILSSMSPASALAENEARFNSTAEIGGYSDKPSERALKSLTPIVTQNGALMQKVSGVDATPTLVYCDSHSDKFITEVGAPQHIDNLIGGIGVGCHD